MSAGQIAERFRSVSRPAISRHLRILRECGVVTVERRGKSRRYALDPRPLAAIREGWLARFADMHVASLRALRQRVEG